MQIVARNFPTKYFQVIGRYPIPAPTKYEYARIFGISPAEIRLGNEIDGAISVIGDKSAEPDEQTRTLSIFELLECIVNKVGNSFLMHCT